MPLVLGLIYLTFAVLCGVMGRKTAFGFLGHFLLALLITPFGDFVIQLVGRPPRSVRRQIEKISGE